MVSNITPLEVSGDESWRLDQPGEIDQGLCDTMGVSLTFRPKIKSLMNLTGVLRRRGRGFGWISHKAKPKEGPNSNQNKGHLGSTVVYLFKRRSNTSTQKHIQELRDQTS